jgi:hypothetical protein
VKPTRISLDETDFRDLVAGLVVRLVGHDGSPVELILSDIGWTRMTDAIAAARADRAPPRDAEPRDPEDDGDC